jgi:hypothetical protein
MDDVNPALIFGTTLPALMCDQRWWPCRHPPHASGFRNSPIMNFTPCLLRRMRESVNALIKRKLGNELKTDYDSTTN